MPTYEGFLEELRGKFPEGDSPTVQALQVAERCVHKVMDLDSTRDHHHPAMDLDSNRDDHHPAMYLLENIKKLMIMKHELAKKVKVLSTEVENKRNEVVLLHKEINRTKKG